MADKLVTLSMKDVEADGSGVIGRVVNIYTSYATAQTWGESGLASVKAVNRLTGAAGSAITQVAKTTGVTVDNNGMFVCYLDDNNGNGKEYFLRVGDASKTHPAGREGGPIRIVVR